MKRWLIILAPLLALALSGAGYWVWWTREESRIARMSFEDLSSAFQAGEYRPAFRAARRLATGGDSRAQALLGWMYQEGLGTRTDYVEALNWYLRAADSGRPQAMAGVLDYYRRGRGLEHPNPYGAARWAERLAELGNPHAQEYIGNAYLDGSGVAKDLERGLTWLQRAIDAGNSDAMTSLARAYRNGTFGRPDHESALRWYLAAVRFGDSWARLDAVRMLKDESLPVFDLEQAYFWALVGTAWSGERSIIPESLAIEIVEILYYVPDGILSGHVDVSGFTSNRASPPPSPADYDYESWPRRLDPEAQRRVEAEARDMLAQWPEPPMTE